VFAEANRFLPRQDHYEITLVGGRADGVMCSSGMEFKVHHDYLNYAVDGELLLVAGGPRYPEYQPQPAFVQWLHQRAYGARRVGAVCNGVFLLGHAGLLAGREITTHWDHAQRLSDQFPGTHVRPDKIFVRDGNLFTCGGVTAGIDLCLALIAEDWGHDWRWWPSS
jgi:transcriptional regulator GlxA family with amidase domain